MSEPSFWQKLKRRHVVKVGVAYVVVAAGVGGAADAFLPALEAPAWALPTLMAFLVLGLPVALVLAWAYELTPEGIVRDTAETVSQGAEAEAPSTAVTVEEERKSIVVLPFDNMSPDPNDAYFSDGLTEEIITQLSYLRSLRVISRNSAMALRDTRKSTREIGQELGVQYVMEGSVRKAGDSLRITAQLIDARSDEHLWAETYAREMEDVFGIQSAIALSVANEMKASLDAHGRERIAHAPTESLEAYNAYLLGWHHLWAATESGARKAKQYFVEALELDPNYAPAHAGLASWFLWAGGGLFDLVPVEEAIAEARAEAKAAIALDPDLGQAYGTLSWVEWGYEWEWEKAERTARTGVDRDPNSYWAWFHYAHILGILGKQGECLEAVARAVELDPLSAAAANIAGFWHLNAGRMDDALHYARKSEELDHGFIGSWIMGMVHQVMGDDAEALGYFARNEEAMRRTKGAWGLTYALGRSGRREEFDQSAAALKKRVEQGTATWTELALAYMGVGDHELALDYLERTPEQRPPPTDIPSWIGVWPHFAPIRDHPRFQAVLKRLGLPTKHQIERHA